MVTAVPSRFAVLSIEDDESKPRNIQKSIKINANIKTKDEKQKRHRQKNDKKKQNKEKKKNNVDGQQWEQWKEKDSMVVEETYEQELQEAILLSKLSYQEAQMEIKSKIENNQENNKKSNKKSKKSTMSLEQFKNLNAFALENIEPMLGKKNYSLQVDTEFFQKVEKEATQVLTREKENAALKVRLNQLDDSITSAQLRTEIEKRDNTIKELEIEIEKLREELSNVKNRNRRLYQILQQGEMKDKAAVLAEVTKLQEIRDELTLEVTSLHAQLEQERSKTRASNIDFKTTKQNRRGDVSRGFSQNNEVPVCAGEEMRRTKCTCIENLICGESKLHGVCAYKAYLLKYGFLFIQYQEHTAKSS